MRKLVVIMAMVGLMLWFPLLADAKGGKKDGKQDKAFQKDITKLQKEIKNLQEQIDKIQLTQGPPGPQGVAGADGADGADGDPCNGCAEIKTALCDYIANKGDAVPGLCMTCGNGIVEYSEVCDDGNSVESDACSNSCVFYEAPAEEEEY